MVNVPFFRRRSRARCILDIPFSEYDPITYLPPFINIGAKSITPLVTLPQGAPFLS